MQTLETFLDADGNVAGTAQRLFTHRHTVRYRLERVRELSGLDVGSSDGREKLSLGLKAMRVLGIARPRRPRRRGRRRRPPGCRGEAEGPTPDARRRIATLPRSRDGQHWQEEKKSGNAPTMLHREAESRRNR